MSQKHKALLCLLAANVIFGFSFLFSKIAFSQTSPMIALSIRFLLAFALLNVLVLCKVVRLRIGGRDIRKLLLVSLLEPTLYFICESYGIKWTSTSFSGAVIALIPVAAMALGAIFLKEKPTLLQTLSMLCSIAGVVLISVWGQKGGTVTLPGFLLLIGAVINTILDPVFIFIFHLGVAGAAWATIIGQFFSFIFAILYIRKFKNIRLTRKDIGLSLKECAQTASLGMSNSLNQVAITLVQIVLNNSLTYYGAMSVYGKEIPLAACGIVMKTNAILLAVIIGISQGSQPIIGFNYGARQYDRVRRTYKLAVTANLIVSAVGFILFQFFPYQIISLFGTGDAAYFEFAIHFMRVFLFMVLVNGVQLISSNFFAAIGKPVKGLILSMTRQVLFLIPLVLILPLFFGLDGILYAGPAADSIAFIVTIVLIGKELKKMKQMEQQSASALS